MQTNTTGQLPVTKRRYTPVKMLIFLSVLGLLTYSVVPILLHSSIFREVVLRPFPGSDPETAPIYEHPPSIGGIPAQENYFKTKDGSLLHSWYYKKPGSTKLVVFHHGNAGNICHRLGAAISILDAGASVLLYDYRGYGKSRGTPTIPGIVEDGMSAFEFGTEKLGYTSNHIFNYGESIGTGVACQVASAKPCAGLILQSSIGSLPLMGRHIFPFLKPYPDCVFPHPHLNNVEQIKLVTAPVLLFHGQKDTLAPFHHSELIYANANDPKKLVPLPECGHNDISGDKKEFTDALRAFLAG